MGDKRDIQHNWRELRQVVVLSKPELVTQQDVQTILRIKSRITKEQRKILKDLEEDLFH